MLRQVFFQRNVFSAVVGLDKKSIFLGSMGNWFHPVGPSNVNECCPNCFVDNQTSCKVSVCQRKKPDFSQVHIVVLNHIGMLEKDKDGKGNEVPNVCAQHLLSCPDTCCPLASGQL